MYKVNSLKSWFLMTVFTHETRSETSELSFFFTPKCVLLSLPVGIEISPTAQTLSIRPK